MTRIVAVHGIWNHEAGTPAQEVRQERAESWATQLSAGLGITQERLEVSFAYYAPHLASGVAQGGEDDLETLPPDAQEMAAQWAAESARASAAPREVAQGWLSAPLRQLVDRNARQHNLDSALARKFVALYFREVAAYLREPGTLRAAAREEVARTIAAHRPRVVVAHSLGSVVAYEALHAHPELTVDLLLTLGSPLALPGAVFEKLAPAPADGCGQRPPGVRRWVNIADHGDIVAVPPRLSRRFRGIDSDLATSVGVFNFHAVAGYLRCGATAKVLGPYVQK